MAEILKKGLKNICECNFCGSLIKYQKEDIKEKEYYVDSFRSCFEKFIICPQCESVIILRENNKRLNES